MGTGGEGQGTTKVILATSMTPALVGREKTKCPLQRTTTHVSSKPGSTEVFKNGAIRDAGSLPSPFPSILTLISHETQ